MLRKIYYWKLRNSELALGERTLIMGVLNVTPDSFSDGGMYQDPDAAYARALELEQEGADIIDIGAESTRPGSRRISADEEWQRLVPVLKRLRGNLGVPLSLDTYKSEIAQRAFDYGVEIINDPGGLTFDPNLAKVVASANAGLVLNHMRGNPESWAKLPPMPDAPGGVARDLEATVNRARRAGVEQNRIVIDPGIGFGKRGEQNAEILAHLGELARLELPILVGPSRKAFLRQKSDEETIFATAAAVTAAILKGAHIVRVHDVKQMAAAALVADEILRAGAGYRSVAERSAARAAQRPQRPNDRGEAPANGRIPRPPVMASRAAAAGASIPDAPDSPREREAPGGTPDGNRERTVPDRRQFRGEDRRENRGERQDRGDRFRGEQRGPERPGNRPFRNDRGGSDRRPPNRFGDRPNAERPPRDRFGDRDRPRGDMRGNPARNAEGGSGRTERPRTGEQGRRGERAPKRVFRKRP